MPVSAPDPRLQAFGFAVRTAREQTGMTIEALAEAAGISWRFLLSIEHGRRNPSLLTILSIADGLQLPPGDLLDNARRPKDPTPQPHVSPRPGRTSPSTASFCVPFPQVPFHRPPAIPGGRVKCGSRRTPKS
ncbi:helix-turn-helix transcriptional regulator [Spirillospora sp. NPDC046719]